MEPNRTMDAMLTPGSDRRKVNSPDYSPRAGSLARPDRRRTVRRTDGQKLWPSGRMYDR